MKDFNKFREQLNEYGLTPAMLKKSNPLRGKGYPHNESQRFGGKTNIPASPEIKKHIESGKAKILINVQSASHPSARFLVIKNPKLGDDFGNTRANQDKVLMAITSDPKRGRIKMFSFHGSHVSHQKAMDFAKKHKLVAMKDKDGNPLYAKESVELDEVGYMGHRPRVGGNRRTGMTRAKQLEMEKRKRERARANAKRLRGESVELHEITKIYKAKSRAEYQKLYGAASDAMYDKMLGRGGMVGDRSKLTVKMKFKDEKSRKKFERTNKSLISESVELNEAKKGELQQYEFPNERKAMQFIKDIENSAVASGKLMQKNKKQVIVSILPGNPKVIDSSLAKYSKKNGGKQINQRKSGPWNESITKDKKQWTKGFWQGVKQADEDGTDRARENRQRITPGQPVRKFVNKTESTIHQLQKSYNSKMPVDININGNVIHVTPDISESLITLHDELNEENQIKMRDMISSDSSSFVKLAKFAQER